MNLNSSLLSILMALSLNSFSQRLSPAPLISQYSPTRTVNAPGGQIMMYDITLTAPVMVIDPLEINEYVPFDTIVTRTITVSNTGDGVLNWNATLSTTGKQMVSVPASDGKFPRGNAPTSFGRAPVVNQSTATNTLSDLLRGSIGYAFEIFPESNFFSFDTDHPSNPTVISPISITPFGGTFDAVNNDNVWVIDYNDGFIKKVCIATGTVTSVGYAGLISGQTPTGLTCDHTTGILYASATDGSTSTLYTVNPATGAATVVGNTNDPLLIDITVDGTGQMYGYDIGDDNAYLIDKTTGASTVIGSIGFNASYAQGMGWDPVSDNIYLAAYNISAGGVGELRVLDRTTGNTALIGAFAGETDALTFAGTCCGPWLSIDKSSGTLLPGATDTITVTLDGTAVPSREFGHGTITFRSDPDVGTVVVPVNMLDPVWQSYLTGYVTHAGIPVPNAIVTATKEGHAPYTAVTGADGHYLIGNLFEGIYEVNAEAPGFNPYYLPDVVINFADSTTLDIYLTAPEIVVNPTEITINMCPEQTATHWLTISNTGDGTAIVRGSAHINRKQAIQVPASNGEFPRGSDAPSFGRAPVNKRVDSRGTELLEGSMAYAFDIYPNYNFFSFNTDDPSSHNVISPITIAPFGATFDSENTDFIWVIDYNDGYVKKADVTTGDVISVGYAGMLSGHTPTGLTCDKTTGILYGSSTNGSESTIYTIDPATGAATVIGNTNDPLLIDITIDGTGQMYGIDIGDDNAYLIDKATGASTVIGSIGFDANYAQGMGWDPMNDIIYLAAFNNATMSGELRILDRVTGNTTLVGGMGGDIDGLAFPGYGISWMAVITNPFIIPGGAADEFPVYFNTTNLSFGIYTGYITFSIDPQVGDINIPVILNIFPAGCPALSIDQIIDAPAGPVSVQVNASGITNMGLFQFTVDYDASKLVYTGTSDWYPEIENVLVGNPSAGKLTFAWAASTGGVTISEGTFFNLDFMFNGSVIPADIIWSDDPTQREFTDWDGNIFVPTFHNGFVVCWIGIPENGAKQSIRVYPNPASEVVTLKSDFCITGIEVLSSLGQTVYKEYYPGRKESQFNISALPEGIYLVRVYTDQGIGMVKVAVEH